jgi:hypothetical protein
MVIVSGPPWGNNIVNDRGAGFGGKPKNWSRKLVENSRTGKPADRCLWTTAPETSSDLPGNDADETDKNGIESSVVSTNKAPVRVMVRTLIQHDSVATAWAFILFHSPEATCEKAAQTRGFNR